MTTIRRIEQFLNNLEGYIAFAEKYAGDDYWTEQSRTANNNKATVLDFLSSIGIEAHKNKNNNVWSVDTAPEDFAY